MADRDTNAKRQKPNIGSALRKPPGPDFEKGVKYWEEVEASVDGVLGGFGNGPVPHIDQLTSRLLLLSLIPSLQKFPNPLTPLPPPLPPTHRLTALDVGAGIGRVTNHVLLPLFDDVVLVEPVEKFIQEAKRSSISGEWRDIPLSSSHPRVSNVRTDEDKEFSNEMKRREVENGRGKRVWFVKAGLQFLDPKYPGKGKGKGTEDLGIIGKATGGEGNALGDIDSEMVYDVIWCQWCLGHLSTPELIGFFAKSKKALRQSPSELEPSFIIVKENVCEDAIDGTGAEFLDEEDSSLTRSNLKWLEIFKDAGLKVVKEQVQEGLPEELFVVKTWALQ